MAKTKKEEKKPETLSTLPEVVKPEEKQEIVKVVERIIENREVAPLEVFGKLTRAQIDLIKRTVAKDASDDELKLFLAVCHGARLNPFLRQAHLVPFWDSKAGEWRRVIIIGIDGFRSIAESSGVYAGNDDPEYRGEEGIGAKRHPLEAKVAVYKVVEGQRYPFTATARWSEYYPGEKKGYQWDRMPYMMLGKCAEALALRKAFPKLLSGIYAPEEMDQATQIADHNPEVKQAKAFGSLLKLIAKCNKTEIGEWIEKISNSDKYTPEQKTQFSQAVDARIAELEAQAQPK